MTDADHWNNVYAARDEDALAWFEAEPGLSAELIAAHATPGAVGDVTDWWPKHPYALWHDRAVLHFLTDEEDIGAYLKVLDHALAPGGTAIIGTFAEDGPEKCSGLTVRRYAPDDLAAVIEAHLPGVFTPVESRRHTHPTQAGNQQRFQFSVFRKAGA